jgi:hypothetical protein
MQVTEPEAVLASHLFYPIRIYQQTVHQIETTSRRYSANTLPMLRDATGKPVVLTEEIGIGTIVQIALAADGTMNAVKIVKAVWSDPFAEAA